MQSVTFPMEYALEFNKVVLPQRVSLKCSEKLRKLVEARSVRHSVVLATIGIEGNCDIKCL